MHILPRVAPHLPSRSPNDRGEYFGWNLSSRDQDWSVHLKARGTWVLRGFDDQTGTQVRLPLPPGEFTLEFPSHSVNLEALVIDPDPGGGGGLE